jgi:hypothetical protein
MSSNPEKGALYPGQFKRCSGTHRDPGFLPVHLKLAALTAVTKKSVYFVKDAVMIARHLHENPDARHLSMVRGDLAAEPVVL